MNRQGLSWNGYRTTVPTVVLLLAVTVALASDGKTVFLRKSADVNAVDSAASQVDRSTAGSKSGRERGRLQQPVLKNQAAMRAPKTVTKATRKPGKKKVVKQEAAEDSEESTVSTPNNFDALPLRGWTILHDGRFDPQTESAYDVLQTERILAIGQTEDPQSFESGVIDIQATLTKLANRYPDGLEGYVQLDWEEPFFEILHHGPKHPKYEMTLANVTEFVRRFKAVFPKALVTHYNLPALPYWVKNSEGRTVSWDKVDKARSEEVLEELEAMRPLLDEMDWFLPRYYDFVPTDQIPEDRRAEQVASEYEHRATIVRWLRDYVDNSHRPGRKILPATRTNWVGGATDYREWVEMAIPVTEYVDEQVMPALRNGADGIMIWQGYEVWMLHLAFIPPESISTELREKSLAHLRLLGVLGENELPNWRDTAQMRSFQRMLGQRQMPYVAATATVMRSGIMPPVATSSADDIGSEQPGASSGEGKKEDGPGRIRIIPSNPRSMRITVHNVEGLTTRK